MALDDIASSLKLSEPTGNKAFDAIDPWEGFLRSTASAATWELLGHEPSPEIQGYRSEHPGFALMGELGGIGGAYGLAFKGLGKLPKYNAALDSAFGLGETAGSGAARLGAETATVEAGRVAGAAATGGDAPQTAEEGVVNTALGLGLGGLGGLLRASGKVDKSIKASGLNIDMKEPPQVHLKAMNEAIASGQIPEADLPAANAVAANMKEAILSEELGKDYKYVSDLDTGDAQPINRLFKTGGIPEGATPDVVRKRFVPSGRDFSNPGDAEAALDAAGISSNLDGVQFPRMIAFNSKTGARSVESEIKNNLTSVGPGEFLGKEKEGLYVYAKKIVGEVGQAESTDRWTLFKTHDPNRFASNAEFAQKVTERNAWLADKPVAPAGRDIFDEAQQMYEQMPMRGYYQAASGKSAANAIGALTGKFGLEGESELVKRMKGLVRETFAPAMYEYKNNPRAQYLFAQSRAAFQKAEAIAHAMTFGDEGLEKASTIWGKILKGSAASGKFGSQEAFSQIINSLSKDGFADFVKAWDKQLGGQALAEAVGKREIGQEAFDALKKAQGLDDYLIKQTKITQEATGEKGFSPIAGHYLLPRTWEGDWRIPIYSDSGKLVYMASGKTKAGVETQAQGILKDAEAKGWSKKEAFLSDTDRDFDLAQQVRVGSPEYMTAAALKSKLLQATPRPESFQIRAGVAGYKTTFTKEELIKKFYDNVLRRNRYLAEATNNKILGSEMTKLGIENKSTYDSLARRMNAMAGRQGDVNRAINEVADRVFAPALGKNSASSIGRAINKTMHHLTIGAFNLQNPVVNALTFVQTVLPRIAFTLEASPSSLASAYSWLPVIDRAGIVKGSFGYLEPFRIMKQSFAEMRNPSDELKAHFAKALRDGTADPKFVEEWVGQNAQRASSIRETLKGEQGYGKFLESVSNFLPSTSEKLSRGNAFVVGHILGRGLGLADDGLYRFAKEFTEKTMYNYATADRPRIFTGPVGSVFGQFKNWTMHYLGNMLEYAGEGYNHNNWAPFLYQLGGTSALGGLSATALSPIGDHFSKWLADKSLMQNVYSMYGGSGDSTTGNFSDAVYHGLPMFLGLSLSASVSDPLSDPSRNAGMMFSFVQANRAQALGKALEMSWENWKLTGQHPVDSEATRDLLINALAPKVLARIAQGTEDDGIKSLNTGGKILSGMNLAEKMMYDAGFMPKRVQLARDVNEELWQEQDEMRAKVQTLGRLWHDAEKESAYDVLTALNKQAMLNGIPIDRIIASAKGLERKESVPQAERKFKAQDLMKFQNLNIVP